MTASASRTLVTEPPVWLITIVDAVESKKPPHHLLLGNAAFDGAIAKLDELRKDFAASETIARFADFPDPKLVFLE